MYQANGGSIQLSPNTEFGQANINFTDHPMPSQLLTQQDPNDEEST